MLHTKRFVGGLLVAAVTTTSVVALDVVVDALDIVNRPASVSTPVRRTSPQPVPPVSNDQAGAYAMLDMINAERGQRGLAPFAWHPLVASAALSHSTDMARRGVMSHDGSDGSDAGDRLRRAGFSWTAWGENIAAGYSDAASVLAAWMGSSGHRRQLLANYTYVGIAVVASANGTPYWTLDFANGG